MADYISREDAVCIADYAADVHPYSKDRTRPETYSDYNQGWNDACDYIRGKLETAKPTETDYISREAVLNMAYWHGCISDADHPYPDGVDAVDVSDIEKIPAADVKPVRQRWIPATEPPKIAFNIYQVAVTSWPDEQLFSRIGYWDGTNWLTAEKRKIMTKRVAYWMPLPEPPGKENYKIARRIDNVHSDQRQEKHR